MTAIKLEKLRQKGWPEQDIKRAGQVLETTHHHDLFLSKIVFWSALIVIVFANLIVSLIMIPFLIVFSDWLIYIIIIILAGMIGFLYNFLITDIGYLEKKHHIIAGILIPVIAIANIFAMVFTANKFIATFKLTNVHNPIIISIIFAVAFILPYFLDKLFLADKKKALLSR